MDSFTITPHTLRQLAEAHGTPLFVYDKKHIGSRAGQLLALRLPDGLTVRYAMKANNHPGILTQFHEAGLHFDASSSYEVDELLGLGVPGSRISLSSQQPAHNLDELLAAGVLYVATSMHQLELFTAAKNRPETVGLRVNPGIGAGHNNRTMTGGPNSSFGLWNTYVPEALALAKKHGVRVDRLHIHMGSGADPSVWEKMFDAALEIAGQMPDVISLDMGGGYKIRRYGDEKEADMTEIIGVFRRKLAEFSDRTGRKLKIEIEPGSWLIGHAGVLLATVVDIVDTGKDGHRFIRLDTGMNDITRPGLYGAQHGIAVLNDVKEKADYVIVGHNCETGDILTPAPGDPEGFIARRVNRAAIGDVLAIYDAGAYCRSMSLKGYNSFPSAREILA